jgi:hypothetical protein
MFIRFKTTQKFFSLLTITIGLSGLLLPSPNVLAMVQENKPAQKDKKAEEKELQQKDTGKVPTPKEIEKDKKKQEAAPQVKLTPAEVLAEYVIIAFGTRGVLQTARANIQEEGTIRLATDQGDISGTYLLRHSTREKSVQDLLRVDLDLNTPEAAQSQGAAKSIKYIIAYNGASVWSAQNNQYVNPRPEAEAAFRAQLTHDYSSLLRYKEDGSTLDLKKPETLVGVDCNVLEMTSPDGSKTTYWISTKTYRIVQLEYSLSLGEGQKPVKYQIAYFYSPFKVIQNTLVPTRRKMSQDGKFVQEVIISQCTYGTKFEADVFQHLP